jgi:hypothetical protein
MKRRNQSTRAVLAGLAATLVLASLPAIAAAEQAPAGEAYVLDLPGSRTADEGIGGESTQGIQPGGSVTGESASTPTALAALGATAAGPAGIAAIAVVAAAAALAIARRRHERGRS